MSDYGDDKCLMCGAPVIGDEILCENCEREFWKEPLCDDGEPI